MSHPKIGMHYEDVSKRVKRISANASITPVNKKALTDSLLNQAELANKGASAEIKKEVSYRGGCDTNLINRKSATFNGLGDAWDRIFGGKK